MSDRVLVTIDQHVAHVRLNRPEKRNGLDLAMFEAIAAAGEGLRHARGVRAVVLSGEGKAFCSGLDWQSFLAHVAEAAMRLLGERDAGGANLAQRVARVWAELERLAVAVSDFLRRFATGTLLIWYPIKDEAAVESFFASLAAEKYLRMELDLGPRTPDGKLAACGLAVINPPWKFEEAMREALPWIAARLGDGARSSLVASPASTPAQA
jgi:hypothetical protein